MTTTQDKKPQHGGARSGSGRKKGTGKYREATKVMRIPESKVQPILDWLQTQVESTNKLKPQTDMQNYPGLYLPQIGTRKLLAQYSHKVAAGFPSPADDYIENRLDLNEKLIKDKNATFILKVQGESMIDAGIMDGDLLIVDRSIEPKNGKIVIAALNGELTVKRLLINDSGTFLMPENKSFPAICVTEENDMVIWGVVTSSIHQF